jgi:hypothetical protein
MYQFRGSCLDELKLKIVAAIETVIPQILENTWRKIEYILDFSSVMKGSHAEVV